MRNVSLMIVVVAVVTLCVSAPTTARAETLTKIAISGVSVNQTADSSYPIERLIDDSGMSGTDLEVQTPMGNAGGGANLYGFWRQTNFEGAPNVIADSEITFDLGADQDVIEMKVWNYAEMWGGTSYGKWGVKDFTLWQSDDDVTYTQVGLTHTLTQNLNGLPNDQYDTISLTGVNARYLRMDLINIHAGIASPANYGLGEVRFYAPVPEPGTLVLLASGLFGLVAYVWRKRR